MCGRMWQRQRPPTQLIGTDLRVLSRRAKSGAAQALTAAERLVRHGGPDSVQPAPQVLPAPTQACGWCSCQKHPAITNVGRRLASWAL